MKARYIWCSNQSEISQSDLIAGFGKHIYGKARQRPRFVTGNEKAKRERCPVCGRLLRLKTINLEPFSSYVEAAWVFPPHKYRVHS
jgi:hypothetical protein